MKIIKEGKNYIADCPDCGSTLQYEPSDITRKFMPPVMYEMEGYDKYSIKCPCGSNIDVSSKISSGIAKKVEDLEKQRDLSDLDI